ncbi:MAG: Rieske (2Fe-2S) protein [Nocardioides sp.]
MTIDGIGRRHALTGAAGLGLALPVLAACGGGDDPAPGTDAEETSGGAGGTALGPTSDVPVGGGTIFADEKVVVVQPTEGDFKAFTAVCTHLGCLVGQVEDEEIQCPCHGSAFSIADGSVLGGPAPSPLSEVGISVEGDEITLT